MLNGREKIDWLFTIQFAVDDFRSKYAGSIMGVTWAFIQPLMTIIIYWFIFQVGFASKPVDGYPYILWLISGIVPWFLISEAIPGVTSCLVEYSYLVKKVLFNIHILPISKIISSFLVHIFLVILTIVCFIFWGYFPDIYYLQLPYYMLYMIFILAGVGYCTAALYPFFKDLLQIVNIVIQIVFWLTPIVWNINIMSETIRKILILNPIYYIVNGYRNIFIYKQFFWVEWQMGIYYWVIAVLFLVVGKKIFEKMRPHFADVL